MGDGNKLISSEVLEEFEKLVYTHRNLWVKYASKYSTQPEDAVQDGLLKAFIYLNTFRGESKLETWLISIIKSSCITQYRKIKIRPDQNFEFTDQITGNEVDNTKSIEEEIIAKEQINIVKKVVNSLYSIHRNALNYNKSHSLSKTERVRRHRAIILVRKKVLWGK